MGASGVFVWDAPGNLWTREPVNRWISEHEQASGLMNLMKQWTSEPVNQMKKWTRWTSELHEPDEPVNQSTSQPVNHWTSEPHEPVNQWISEPVNQWIRWINKWTNETSEPVNQWIRWTSEPANHMKVWGHARIPRVSNNMDTSCGEKATILHWWFSARFPWYQKQNILQELAQVVHNTHFCLSLLSFLHLTLLLDSFYRHFLIMCHISNVTSKICTVWISILHCKNNYFLSDA